MKIVVDTLEILQNCALINVNFLLQAYIKPRSTAVQITKIIAVTVVLTAVILGSFLLASAYVSANANWKQLEQELELLGETSDRLHPPPQPEALIAVSKSESYPG